MEVNDLILLAKIRGVNYQSLLLRSDYSKINKAEADQLAVYKRKLVSGFPMAYLLGEIEFLGRSFKVNEKVLIPRPETEDWVKQLIVELKERTNQNKIKGLNILEIGCGSGVIGLSLMAELENWCQKLVLADISAQALSVALQNLNEIFKNPDINSKVELIRSDLMSRVSQYVFRKTNRQNRSSINLLVANLPYLPDTDRGMPAFRNLKYEPSIALYSGSDGLNLFRRLIQQIFQKGYAFDEMWFELDPRNMESAKEYSGFILPDYHVNIYKDFNQMERVLVLSKSNN